VSSKPRYSPLAALKQLTHYEETDVPRGQPVPVGLVNEQGIEIHPLAKIETCCILLLAFTAGSPMVPDDFHNVPKSGTGLREYVRPDGGVYLGSFEAPNDPGGCVVVYGDPMMTEKQAVQASLRYRRKLMQNFMDSEVSQTLGPFAAATPSLPSQD
jgi:hypothetical protein